MVMLSSCRLDDKEFTLATVLHIEKGPSTKSDVIKYDMESVDYSNLRRRCG